MESEKENENENEQEQDDSLINEIAALSISEEEESESESDPDPEPESESDISDNNKEPVKKEEAENEEEETKASENEKEDEVKKEPDSKENKKEEPSQVDKLMAEIERLSGLIIKPEPEQLEKIEEKKAEDKDNIFDFIKDLDMNDISADPKVFNQVLHEVAIRVEQQTTEQILKQIPQLIMPEIQQQTYFKQLADKFYDDNSDLVNVKQVVRACAEQIQKDNPEWEIEKVFTETATKTRETLGIPAHTITDDKDVPSLEDAAFANSRGGSKSNLKQRKSTLQTELDEL